MSFQCGIKLLALKVLDQTTLYGNALNNGCTWFYLSYINPLKIQLLKMMTWTIMTWMKQEASNLRKLAQKCVEAETLSRTVINKDPLHSLFCLDGSCNMPSILLPHYKSRPVHIVGCEKLWYLSPWYTWSKRDRCFGELLYGAILFNMK